MRKLSTSAKIVVTLQPREDGGLRAYSDDVPGFVLSHSDAHGVLADVEPALETILSELFNEQVSLSELVSVRDRVDDARKPNNSPPTEMVTREYVVLLGPA